MSSLLMLIAAIGGLAWNPAAPQLDAALAKIRARVVPGEIAVDITSASAPAQRYAVYLPSGYTEERAWPVLFLMDPRGRATLPMRRFVDGAERRGWVLVSSYNTASDTEEDLNTPALQAMLVDSSRLFRLDSQRVYLTGFSGTARMAWPLAGALGEWAAGIIGFGGALPGPPPERFGSFAFYGGAGFTDFNYQEMRQLDRVLDEAEVAHRLEFFPGPHAWGPQEVCARAVDWMELQAMRDGRRLVDASLIEAILAQRLAEAAVWDAAVESADAGTAPAAGDPRQLERRGPVAYEAWLRYAAIAEDFGDLVTAERLAAVTRRAATLEARREVARARDRADELAGEEARSRQRASSFIGLTLSGQTELNLPTAIRVLELRRLKARAEDASDPAEALSAQRRIAALFVQVSFYLPRADLAQGNVRRALDYLALADFLRPDDYGVQRMLARAYALRGEPSQAVAALRRAHAIFALDADLLASDPQLAEIRDSPEYRALLEEIGGAPRPHADLMTPSRPAE